jgi:hypothetical protein
LIEEARKEAESEKTEADKQKRLAEEAKAKQEATAAELRKMIALAVYYKGSAPSNPSGGRYDAFITAKCTYENVSPRDIRAFKGALIFQDLFGSQIYQINLTISDPIKAGAKANWSGAVQLLPEK